MPTLKDTRRTIVNQIGTLLTAEEIRSMLPKAARNAAQRKRTYDKLADPVIGGRPLRFSATVVEPKSDILQNREHLGQTVALSGLYDARGPRGGRYFVGEARLGNRVGRFKMSAAQIDTLFGVGARQPKPIPMFVLWDNAPRAKFIGWLDNPR